MFAQNIRDENGESFIPASQRPDGTWRKARRVKEGYVPQEEVPLYESKGKQFINRSSKPESIVLPSGDVAHQPIPGLFIFDKKEKNKGKKKKNIDELGKSLEQVQLNDTVNVKVSPKNTKSNVKIKKIEETSNSKQATDPAKRLKNLKKRLREVEQLEEKVKNGQISKPEPEQLLKIQRKNDLLMQIRDLERVV